jgi:hypothetical protein
VRSRLVPSSIFATGRPLYVFYPFWYGFLALFGIVAITAIVEQGIPAEDLAFMIFVWTALLVVPFAMHAFGTRNSDDELSQLLDFLAIEAEARPQPESQHPHPRHA